MPTWEEARLLASVRSEIGGLLGLDVLYTDADLVRSRYLDLLTKAGREPVEYSGPATPQQLTLDKI